MHVHNRFLEQMSFFAFVFNNAELGDFFKIKISKFHGIFLTFQAIKNSLIFHKSGNSE